MQVEKMIESGRFTDGRVPDPGIRSLFGSENRWQRWLDVEAALAQAEADLGIVPREAAESIVKAAQVASLDLGRIRTGIAATSHPLMALILELSHAVGDTHGGWVHWGATTQNITQTGDVLVLRDVHRTFLRPLLARVLTSAAEVAERGARMVMPGRTHGQQAVPITFGFKAAVWIDELSRHVVRLRRTEDHVFVAMMGGAAGTFAAFGPFGPEIQARLADRLGLRPMKVPARSIADPFAEYVCVLGMLAGTCGKIAREVITLTKAEFGEAREQAPPSTVGSSTMPHKQNPQLSQDVVAIAAQIRALVPLALEAMGHEHEVDSVNSAMMDNAVRQACVLTGDLLARLGIVLAGLELAPGRMLANLGLTRGLVMSESVMMALGHRLGRQRAHEVVTAAARATAETGAEFADVLRGDPEVSGFLSPEEVATLLDPANYVGSSVEIARDAAERARGLVDLLVTDVTPGAPEMP